MRKLTRMLCDLVLDALTHHHPRIHFFRINSVGLGSAFPVLLLHPDVFVDLRVLTVPHEGLQFLLGLLASSQG